MCEAEQCGESGECGLAHGMSSSSILVLRATTKLHCGTKLSILLTKSAATSYFVYNS